MPAVHRATSADHRLVPGVELGQDLQGGKAETGSLCGARMSGSSAWPNPPSGFWYARERGQHRAGRRAVRQAAEPAGVNERGR